MMLIIFRLRSILSTGMNTTDFDEFREKYKNEFGKDVYVGRYMRWKWWASLLLSVKGKC